MLAGTDPLLQEVDQSRVWPRLAEDTTREMERFFPIRSRTAAVVLEFPQGVTRASRPRDSARVTGTGLRLL